MISTVKFGRLHMYSLNETDTIYSANPVPAAWTEIDVSEYLPEGCPGFRGIVDGMDTSNSVHAFIWNIGIDNTLSITAWYRLIGQLTDFTSASGGARLVTYRDFPITKEQKCWITSYNATTWEARVVNFAIKGFWMP